MMLTCRSLCYFLCVFEKFGYMVDDKSKDGVYMLISLVYKPCNGDLALNLPMHWKHKYNQNC